MLTLDFDRLAVGPGARLLDLGCGAGRHTFEALKRAFSVVSVDLDAAVLKDVTAWGEALLSSGEAPTGTTHDCVNATALQLPFSDASFDVVVASEVLEHIVDDEVALREIARVTKPGGTVVVTVPRRWPEQICWLLSREYHAEAGGHVRIYRAWELRSKIERRGLRVNARHHAHALHSPYWWLKCAFGVTNKDAPVPRAYHRFLVWDITRKHPAVAAVDKALNPVMGKSLVLYAEKTDA